jgi:hypothetical protein
MLYVNLDLHLVKTSLGGAGGGTEIRPVAGRIAGARSCSLGRDHIENVLPAGDVKGYPALSADLVATWS